MEQRDRINSFEIPPNNRSFFGVEWEMTKARYSFGNIDLLKDRLLTKTQYQELAKMTHDSQRVVSKDPTFFQMLASATSMHLVIRGSLLDTQLESFDSQLRARLEIACQHDSNFLEQKPLAIDAGLFFINLVGIPPEELEPLLERVPENVRDVKGLFKYLEPHMSPENP